ncbi:truncated large ankyrin-like protein [Yokapox virus]|uniref:Truncated large ankyrin-like protein n=1 Tax=Yokapox virus TaxID=1076255 RepID=G3EI72_9POXV|nr:truncated large ankyrin-like protein [Yokapox virus]AEN03769.1 truncated large ankyrin-like protein [Yokapox virus]
MYDDIIKMCYISMQNKNNLINKVINKLKTSIIDNNSRLSQLPFEIIYNIISKLSIYDLNSILYGKKHYKRYNYILLLY